MLQALDTIIQGNHDGSVIARNIPAPSIVTIQAGNIHNHDKFLDHPLNWLLLYFERPMKVALSVERGDV